MQLKLHMVTIEDLMPQDHFLRKLDATLDLSFVYEETKHIYSRRYGRPPIDPVMLVKYLLVGYLYGIPSERQIEQRIQTDIALRWYLGLDFFDRVPDHSTISQLRRRKPSFRKVFRSLFECIVRQCIEQGLISGRIVAVDSTHVKANASRDSEYFVELGNEAGAYLDRLDKYEEEGLEKFAERTGTRRKKRTKQVKKCRRQNKKIVSRTDPEAGYMNRPGKPKGQHYLSHQAVDTDNGIITGLTVTSGDVYDSVPFLELVEKVNENMIPIQTVTADSAYDLPLAHRCLREQDIKLYVSPKRVAVKCNVDFQRSDFNYDQLSDSYICPNGKALELKSLSRTSGGLFWVYRAKEEDCNVCPLRDKCIKADGVLKSRKIERSYFTPDRERNLSQLNSAEYREALKKRQIWCEGTFAAQKWGHNLTRVLRRGIEAAEDHCLLSACALNLKRLIRCSY